MREDRSDGAFPVRDMTVVLSVTGPDGERMGWSLALRAGELVGIFINDSPESALSNTLS